MLNKLQLNVRKISVFLVLFLVLFGCGQTDNQSINSENNQMNVVATTTMLTDLLEIIGGKHVTVEGLMGPGIDPHSYRASASTVDSMTHAEIVVYNGLHLEGQLGRVFSEIEQMDKEVFVIEEAIKQTAILDSEDEELPVDPHIWFSVPLWAEAANYITTSLSEYDPDNTADYQENNDAYQMELEELDLYIRKRVNELPEESRFLVTAHDAFKYFGEEYDFEVVGLQGLNTQTEAGTRDVSQLAQFIVDHKIKAIFVETSVPTRTIEALQEAVQQRGWEIEIGGELYSDALGDAEQGAETYLKMYRQNIDTIVDALK